MILGAIYIVWFARQLPRTFEGFLITLGVPMAAWCGVFLADLLLRRRDYDERRRCTTARGRYGAVSWPAVVLDGGRDRVGWGLVDRTRRQAARLAGLLARTRWASAARPAPGRSPTWACCSRCSSASSARSSREQLGGSRDLDLIVVEPPEQREGALMPGGARRRHGVLDYGDGDAVVDRLQRGGEHAAVGLDAAQDKLVDRDRARRRSSGAPKTE